MATTKQKARVPEVLDVGATTEDQQMIASDGGALSAFLGNVVEFLSKARTLEAKAGGMEKTAGTFLLPTSAAEDAALQRFVQQANGVSREIAGHWQITSAFHTFHRRLVALRERGASKAERAAAIAQRLHNRYVDEEKRRVEAENRRREEEARIKAEQERQAELDRLEADARRAEAASSELSAREQSFVKFFAEGMPALEAARRAGFMKPESFRVSEKIQRAVFALKEAKAIRQQAAAKQAEPVLVEPVEEIRPAIEKAGTDRTTWRAEIVDARLFVEAVIGGRHGIPADCLEPCQKVLTDYARSLHEMINKWPGVRAVKTTTTV